MASVIDELVVKLGLDPSAFTAGQKQVVADLRATEEASGRTAKAMAGDGAKAAEWFSQAKNEALSLIGVLIGGKGLESFIKDTTNSLAALGRQARNIGESPQDITEFTNAIAANGGTVDAARASLEGYAKAKQDLATGGRPDLPGLLSIIGADRADSPLAVMKHFMEFVERNKGNPQGVQQIQQIGSRLGFDQGLVNAMVQIGTLAKYEEELAGARRRGVPTPQMIKAYTDLQKAMEEAQQAATFLAENLLSKFVPSMVNALNELTKSIVNPGSITAPPERKDKSWLDWEWPKFSDDEGNPESFGDVMSDWWSSILGRPPRSKGAAGGPRGTPSLSLANPEEGNRVAGYRDRLAADLGLTGDQAAGVLSGPYGESGMRGINERNPVVPGSRGGFGWAQWTGERRVEYEAWAAQRGLDPAADETNYRFLVEDLKRQKWAGVMRGVRNASDPNSAASAFHDYESGGDPGLEATRALHAANADAIARLGRGARGAAPSVLAPSRGPGLGPALDPALTPPTGPGPRASSNDNSTIVNIANLTVHSQAKDAAGIAKDIHKELAVALVNQANRGAA